MTIKRNEVDRKKLNRKAALPFQLRIEDIAIAMQDVYDFFHDVNDSLVRKGLERLDDMLRPANMSGLISGQANGVTPSFFLASQALT
jgi:hypothetical protein